VIRALERPPSWRTMRAMDWGFVAEDADAYQTLPPDIERHIRDDVVLIHSRSGDAWSNLATRIRFEAPHVPRAVAAVRAWFGGYSVDQLRWLVGPSATPTRVVDDLIALGARPDEAEPELDAMVLDHPPPQVADIKVHQVSTISDFAEMERVRTAVFGGDPPSVEGLQRDWHALSRTAGWAAFVAEIDGAVAGYGVMRRTDQGPWLLAGGVTMPHARGRGAYRALVRARWDAAQAMGAPALVTQAQAASRPILERLGFRTAGSIVVLVDLAAGR
jgi:predicted N-acetyltransferase YhbS